MEGEAVSAPDRPSRSDRWIEAMEKAAAAAETEAGRKFMLELVESAKARRAEREAEGPARREEELRAADRRAWAEFDFHLERMHRAGDDVARAAKGAEAEPAARAMVRFLEAQGFARAGGKKLETYLGRPLTDEEWCRGSAAAPVPPPG